MNIKKVKESEEINVNDNNDEDEDDPKIICLPTFGLFNHRRLSATSIRSFRFILSHLMESHRTWN